MPGIGIISNPFAKVNKRDPQHNTLLWYVLGNKGQYEVTESLTDLSRVCTEFEARGIDHVGIVGGDGTISLSLSAIQEAYKHKTLPRILLLRGGTVNVTASNLGIYGKPKNVMHDFLDAYHSGGELSVMKLSTLVVNGRLGFLFANGIASKFLEEFYKNKSNALGAGIFFSRVFGDLIAGGHFTGDFAKLSCDETLDTVIQTLDASELKESKSYSMIFASTLPAMPFGFKMFKNLMPGSGCGEMMAFTAQNRELIPIATRVLAGFSLKTEGLKNHLFRTLNISSKKAIQFSLDGDLMVAQDGKIEISMGPTFEFCSPYGKVW
jgi:diacylglycerol kinase family enzyme